MCRSFAYNALLRIENYSHDDAGNLLSYHVGKMFSTYDQDNDFWAGGNFAMPQGRGAWWYGFCHHSNLNGEYNNTVWANGVTGFTG